MIKIRSEEPGDIGRIRHVNELAFDQPGEADLVDSLRRSNALTLSLVALEDTEIVGHIAFSPVVITSSDSSVDALGLAPMAILPDRQKTGIGSRLVCDALKRCREMSCKIVVVLGEPDYYGRFGFTPSKPHGIEWEHDVPPEFFMVKELRKGALSEIGGIVTYRPEFNAV